MTFFRVDDGFYDHPKLKTIPRGAARESAVSLWTLAGSWSARYLTNGQIPEHMIEELGGKRRAAEWLTAAEFWHKPGHDCMKCPPVPAGHYLYHDWPSCNYTRDEVEAQREAARKRQSKWRTKRHDTDGDDDSGVTP